MIAAAELPLNDRGAVYHLDLLPSELANLIITVGDPARVFQVSQHFDKIEHKRAHREFVTHTGYIGSLRLSVVSTGIGVPNIDIVMNELDALVNINLNTRTPYSETTQLTIIRLGTTGALQIDAMVGEIYLSKFAIGFDTLLDYYEQNNTSHTLIKMHEDLNVYLADESSRFYVAEANRELIKHFSSLGKTGITATCGGFYGPQGRCLRVPLRYPNLLNLLTNFKFLDHNVINFEMETAGILGLGQLLNHRCLSLSMVIANRITGAFTHNVKESVDNLIVKALELITTLEHY